MSSALPFRVGVSGSREGMTPAQRDDMHQFLSDIVSENKGRELFFHHGDCIGVDADSAAMARELGFIIVAHPPIKDIYRAFHDSDIIIPVKDYFDRNRDIVDLSDEMFGVPKSITDTRSGTWYTIKYAQKNNKLITIIEP